jgi:aspartate/methionine/tyrosine aminotransferase
MKADRLKHINEYYFSIKLQEIAHLQAEGKDIINLGIGSPDLPPPDAAKIAMNKIVMRNDTHQYQSYRGRTELRQAIAGFYRRHYGVKLNANDEIIPLTGAKEGIMHISMAFINPGEHVLIPNPGYMTYTSVTHLAGGIPVYYDLKEENKFLPDFNQLQQQDLSKVKLMWINYPHMPTGAEANNNFFKSLIAFGKKHKILIINDNPYSFILTDKPQSLLQISGASDTAMELNSLSKSHNMAGWRIGMLAGKKSYIDTVMKFKSQMDSGMFYGTQAAAVAALNSDENWYKNLNKIYSRRKKIVLEICQQLNLRVSSGQAGMFVWAKLPGNISSKDFTDKLLYEKNIFIAPGFIFGSNGEGFVRISLTNNEAILKKVLHRLT